MPEQVFPGAPTVGRDSPSAVLVGRIIDVDTKRYTVTVRTEQGQRLMPDLPIISPYAHFARGEGFYVIPDINAPCWVTTEGAGTTPAVLGFTNLPQVISKTERDGGEVAREGDEALRSFGARRPQRFPGEFGFTARDGAFLHFRRGGIVEVGGGPACQRLFLPLTNHISDICERYKLFTAAGAQVFESDRTDGSSGDEAKAVWRVMAKAKATDSSAGKEASTMIEAGYLGDQRFRIVVAPIGIDLKDGSFSGQVFTFEVDLSGNLNEIVGGDSVASATGRVVRACGQLDLTVNGDVTDEIAGHHKATVGASWQVQALAVLLEASSGLVLRAPDIGLDGAVTLSLPTWPVPIGMADWAAKYNTHTHGGGAPPNPAFKIGP